MTTYNKEGRALASHEFRGKNPGWFCPTCGIIYYLEGKKECRHCRGISEQDHWAVVGENLRQLIKNEFGAKTH